MSSDQPLIQEPDEVIQFQYNSDWPSLPPAPPAEFPPADPSPCARITTRVYDPVKNQITTVQNVLVKTLLPTRMSSSKMEEDSSSSSTSSDDDSDEEQHVMMDDSNDDTTNNNTTLERAYWMQRTVREAIYGRVLYAIVLKKRKHAQDQAEWEVTLENCAIKEMAWHHIRQERDRLAEDPIKEVFAMQYLQKWYHATNYSEAESDDFFAPIMNTNIMMPLDLLSDDRHLYSIMPYCDGGELFDRLDLNERFAEEEARYWMHQVMNVSIVIMWKWSMFG